MMTITCLIGVLGCGVVAAKAGAIELPAKAMAATQANKPRRNLAVLDRPVFMANPRVFDNGCQPGEPSASIFLEGDQHAILV